MDPKVNQTETETIGTGTTHQTDLSMMTIGGVLIVEKERILLVTLENNTKI